MGRISQGIAVRLLYMIGIIVLTSVIVVMYEGTLKMSVYWIIASGIIALIIECIITLKKTHGYDWKWFNLATIIFAANGLAAIWIVHLRRLEFYNQGIFICFNYSDQEELRSLDTAVARDWLDYCGCGHCNGVVEQIFVILLLIGRYFLPRGAAFYNKNDKVNAFLRSLRNTHFLLVLACNGADVLDLISYARYPGLQGNMNVNTLLLILFSIGTAQFCVDTLATIEEKSSDLFIIVETDLWASILVVLTDDIPYISMRLFLLVNYQVYSIFGTYFIFKNLLSVAVTLHKAVILYSGKDLEDIEDYVASFPYEPELPNKKLKRIDTPDDLDDISQASSEYSQEIPVKSRVEKSAPKPNEWGEQTQWFGDSRDDLPRENTVLSNNVSLDVEKQGTTTEIQKLGTQSDQAYFTDDYAEKTDAKIKTGRLGTKRLLNIPLGLAKVKGKIDFTLSLLRPKSSAKKDIENGKRKQSSKGEAGENDDVDGAVDEIINNVDTDEPKRTKKKNQNAEETEEPTQAPKEAADESNKRKKKRRSKDIVENGDNNVQSNDEVEQEDSKKRRRRKKDKEQTENADGGIQSPHGTDVQEKREEEATSESPVKEKKKRRRKKEEKLNDEQEQSETKTDVTLDEDNKKKKRRNKEKGNTDDE